MKIGRYLNGIHTQRGLISVYCSIPVSYTHLDVYKRQVYWGVICTRIEEKCGEKSITNFGIYVWPGNIERDFYFFRVMGCDRFDILEKRGNPHVPKPPKISPPNLPS